MKKSSFRHYGLNQAERKAINVGRFAGVDYSSQKFLVENGHAIDILNYVYKDGVVQKRNGFEQIFKVQDFTYIPADFNDPSKKREDEIHRNYEISQDGTKTEEGKRVNGIWKFVAEDGKEHIVAHIGRLMYEITDIEDSDRIRCEPMTIKGATASVKGEVHALAYEFENFKSFAYVGGNKLWFQGGNRYMVLRFFNGSRIFTQVQDSDYSPIPVTTMSITAKNAISDKRQSFDDVNLLTKWRKNRLITGVPKNEDEKTKTEFSEFTLDAPLITQSDKDMSGITITIEESGVIN